MTKKRCIILAATMVLAAACAGARQSDKALESTIRSKGIIDLDQLTASEVRLLVSIVKKEASPCPEGLSLAQDLAAARPCPLALSALGFIYRRILDGYPEDDILDQYVAHFKRAREVSILVEGRPDTGPADAPVTIVVFSDFQCPFCRKAASAVKKVRELHPDKVRVVFKQWPLEMHTDSMVAALAAEAALVQGRFWEMHDALFALKGELTDENIGKAAERAGLDLTRWNEDRESPEVIESVEADSQEAVKLKLTGTPTIFVNSVEFDEPVKYLQAYVEELLLDPSP